MALIMAMTMAGAAPPAAAQSPIRPLDFAHAIDMRELAGQGDFAAVSPDGRWLAYADFPVHNAVQGDDDSHDYTKSGVPWNFIGGRLRITDVVTGETRTIAEDEGSHWNPAWSPDGRTLLFLSDRDGAARLWAWDRETGATRRVSPAIVRSFFGWEGASWLPDGRHVVLKVLPDTFTVAQANAHSGVWHLAAAGSDAAGATAAAALPAPGATVAIYRAHVQAHAQARAAPADSAARPAAVDTAVGPTRYFADLVVLDVTTGRVVRRLREGVPVTAWRLSPDATRLAVVELAGWRTNTQDGLLNVTIVPLDGGQPRRVVEHASVGFGTVLSWSPDGTKLAYQTSSQLRPGELCVVAATGGTPRCFGAPGKPDFKSDVRPPLWGPDGDALYAVAEGQLWKASVRTGVLTRLAAALPRKAVELVADASGQRIWSPDGGRSLYLQTRDTATALGGIYKVDTQADRAVKLHEGAVRHGSLFNPAQVSADGRTLAYIVEAAERPTDIWVAGIDFRSARRATRLNPALEPYAFGSARIVTWRTADGLPARGALLLPAGYEPGKRYPLLVRVYGGSTGAERMAYRFGLEGTGFSNMQMLATRGYAVLYPDVPQRLGTPMRDIAAAVLPAVDRVIELGIADPARLGVFGQSYGGYSTISLLVQTSRFKGAAMSAGPANLLSGYGEFHRGDAGTVGWAETGQGLMGGTPWEYRERYLENSPILYLDRVTTPLMIIHGERDLAVPVWQGDAVFVGLRRLGREVEYRRYAGEGHTIRSPANMRDYWGALVRWFDTHVKGSLAP